MEVGFSLGVNHDETAEEVFLQNVRYAEYWHRERSRRNKAPLRERLHSLFDELPKEVVSMITDDLDSLVAEIVRTRNSLVHALEASFERAATGERLVTLIRKIGAMLLCQDALVCGGKQAVIERISVIMGNKSFHKYLAESDCPDRGQLRLL